MPQLDVRNFRSYLSAVTEDANQVSRAQKGLRLDPRGNLEMKDVAAKYEQEADWAYRVYACQAVTGTSRLEIAFACDCNRTAKPWLVMMTIGLHYCLASHSKKVTKACH